MAGVNQHILPNFLLKNFASRQKKKSAHTWLFRKDKKPVEINTRSATEYRFYEDGENSVDPEITEREGAYSRLLREVLNNERVHKEEVTDLVEFVVHLSVRTKHTRQSYLDYSKYAFKKAAEPIKNDFGSYMNKLIQEQPELIVESLMKRHSVPLHRWDELWPNYRNLIDELSRTGVLNHLASSASFEKEQRNGILALGDNLNESDAKQAHIGALKSAGIAPDRRRAHLEMLDWEVISFENDALILGDVGVWSISSDMRAVPLLWDRDIKAAYLPISKNAVLIGQAEGFDAKKELYWINQNTAGLSLERFYAAANTSSEKELSLRLNTLGHFPANDLLTND